MPIFLNQDDFDDTPATPSLSSFASATPEDLQRSARAAVGLTGNQTFFGSLGALAYGATVDLADTVSSSVGLTDRGQISQGLVAATGLPGLRQWYADHSTAIEVGSGIASVVGSEILAGKLLAKAASAGKYLNKVPFANRLTGLDRRYNNALQSVLRAETRAAERGFTGAEQYSAILASHHGVDFSANTAVNAFKRAAVAKGFARNATAEGILAVGANENEVLFSEDTGDNIAWMAAGLGLGVGIDLLQANHIAKGIAGSDVVRRKQQLAYDPYGTEAARVNAILTKVDPKLSERFSAFGLTQGGDTDLATSYLLSAAESANAENTVVKGLAAKRDTLGTGYLKAAIDQLQKVTNKGVGVSGSSFAMRNSPEANAINHAVYRDPAALHGVEMIGVGKEEFILKRQQMLDTQIGEISQMLANGGVYKVNKAGQRYLKKFTAKEAEALRQTKANLDFQNSLEPGFIVNGEHVPVEVGKLFENLPPMEIKFRALDEEKSFSFVDGRAANDQLGIDTDLNLYLPRGKKSVTDLSIADTVGLYNAADRLINHHLEKQIPLRLGRKPNWFQLEMAEALIKRSQGNEALVEFPAGMDRRSARVESFKQRGKELLKLNSDPNVTPEILLQAKFKLNLPQLSSYDAALFATEEHPAEVLLRGMARKDLKNITYEDLIYGIDQVKQLNGLTALAKDRTDNLSGEMFGFMIDHKGKQMAPVLVYRRQMQPFEWTKDNLTERLAMRKMYMISTLAGNDAPEFMREISSLLLNDADLIAATEVAGLRDAQHRSFIPGLDQSPAQTLQDFTSREFRDRDNPQLLATQRLVDKQQRTSRALMERSLRSNLSGALIKLNDPINSTSRILANQFLDAASGWEISKTTVPRTLPNGKRVEAFVLDQSSPQNKARWQQQFGESLPKGATLRGANKQEIVLDQVGREFIDGFQRVAQDINANKNTINKALGLGAIRTKHLYVPPPNPEGKYIGFVLDEFDNPVPGGTIIAKTKQEFQQLKQTLEDTTNVNSPLNKPGRQFKTRDEIEDFNDIWERAQMGFVNPSTTAIQPGKLSRGRLSGPGFNANAVEDAVSWARDQYLNLGNSVLRNLLRDAIKAAEVRAVASRPQLQAGIKAATSEKNRGVFDYYLENIYGKSALTNEASFIGRVQTTISDRADRILAEKIPPFHDTLKRAIRQTLGRAPWDKSPDARQAFQKLTEELGPHMPFRNVTEYVERQFGVKPPKELNAVMADISKFEATYILRIGEVIHPIMNLTGILNAAPAVIRNYTPRRGETVEQYSRRIGHTAQIFNLPDGTFVGHLDMARLSASAFKDAFNRKQLEHYDRWQAKGFITQEVSEVQRQMAIAETREGWKKLIFGNPQADTPLQRDGIVGLASVLSDRSEDFSRAWGHIIGYKLGEQLGIKSLNDLDSFAHDVANKMIANYNPLNRPAIFQGPLGMPIGLFQSFALNYNERLLRYIETKDVRALANQYMMQSALFGLPSVPGWDQVNDLFFKSNEGESSPSDAIYNRFGQSAGDLLYGGIISNLPKLINVLPGEQGFQGADLYSRGDTNVRSAFLQTKEVGGVPLPSVPIVDTVARVVQAIGEGINVFRDSNPQRTDQRLAEIVSNLSQNRPLAGAIETFLANGADTDAYGALVTQTRDLLEQTYRVIGIRSVRQSKELDAFYASKNAQTIQRQIRSRLNTSLRAAIRSGEDVDLEAFQAEYLQSGGDPKRFASFVKDQAEAALTSRGSRTLEQLSNSKNTKAQALVQRLIDFGVSIEDDDDLFIQENQQELDEVSASLPEGYQGVGDADNIEEREGNTDSIFLR